MSEDNTPTRTAVPIWERWLPRLSSGAAVVTAICCTGLSAAISLATAIGATFLTNDRTLEPLLIVSLLITVAGSALTFRRHRNPFPLILTMAAGALVYWTLYGGSGEEAAGGHETGTDHGTHADQHGEHAAPAEGGAAGGHGDASSLVLVWTGLVVLVGAQVWDVVRLRRCRVTPPTTSDA